MKAVMDLPAYKEKPIKPDEVKGLITQKINDQRKYHGPGVRKRKDGEPCDIYDYKVMDEEAEGRIYYICYSQIYWQSHAGWGNLSTNQAQLGDIQDSYELFSFLRSKGVRAHSWV